MFGLMNAHVADGSFCQLEWTLEGGLKLRTEFIVDDAEPGNDIAIGTSFAYCGGRRGSIYR